MQDSFALMLHDVRQIYAGQQGSKGFVWLTGTNPGSVQFATGDGGHVLGLQVTVLVDSEQMQF